MSTRYGVQWPDGTFTGGVTDQRAWAVEYLKSSGFTGRVYTEGSKDDPELNPQVHKEPANIWRAPAG